MSKQVGLMHNGSDAHSLSSRPSETLKDCSALLGGSWARAEETVKNRMSAVKDRFFMTRKRSQRRRKDSKFMQYKAGSLCSPAKLEMHAKPPRERRCILGKPNS